MVRNSGKVLNVDAKCVYENDEFDYEYGFEPKIKHKPALNKRGKIIAVYAVAQLKDGGRQLEVMSVEDIEKVRKASRASTTGPWVDWYDQMCIKTVLKRICKLLPISDRAQMAMAYDETVNTLSRVETNFGTLLPLPLPKKGMEDFDADPEPQELVDTTTGEISEALVVPVTEPEIDPVFA
jgi:recombination protein RecT